MGTYCTYKLVLTTSLLLIVAGLLLTAFTLFSPVWQVAEMEALGVRHEHGLWWDCVQRSGQLIPLADIREAEESAERGPPTPLARSETCAYKFDQSSQNAIRQALEKEDAASKEIMLHRFLPQHKAVLFFGVFTFLFGMIGIVIGICSPCFPPNSLLFVVATFMTTACSVLADIIFVFAAMRTENREVPVSFGSSATVGDGGSTESITYPNGLGAAAYLHMAATALFGIALLCSVAAAYLLITCGETRGEGCCARPADYNGQRHHHHYFAAEKRPDRGVRQKSADIFKPSSHLLL